MAKNPIEVRHSTASDAEGVHRLYSEPSVIAGTLQLPYSSVELWKKRLSEVQPGWILLVACRGSEVIGQLGVEPRQTIRRKHAAGIGMAVSEKERRRGVGSALVAAAIELCDRWMAIKRLELEVYIDNEAAIGLYKKFGFKVEGTLKQYAFRDGELVDAYVMGRVL
jgi:putative acetyltransferase